MRAIRGSEKQGGSMWLSDEVFYAIRGLKICSIHYGMLARVKEDKPVPPDRRRKFEPIIPTFAKGWEREENPSSLPFKV